MSRPCSARPDRLRRLLGVVVGLIVPLALLAGCSIQPNSAPRDVPPAQRPALDPEPEAGRAVGSGRVFLLTSGTGEPQLRSVPRDADPGGPIIQALLDGPNEDELDAGLQTALPAGLDLHGVRATGATFGIDLGEDLLDLSSAQLRVAIAQLVFTASEIEGVTDVRILVDGVARPWPNGRGELRTSPLTIYDFPGFAETTQPRYPVVPSARPALSATGE